MSSCLHVSLIPARVLTVLLQVLIALPISVISANFKKNFFVTIPPPPTFDKWSQSCRGTNDGLCLVAGSCFPPTNEHSESSCAGQDHEKDKEEGLGIDGPADPAALSLRDINARSERSLEMLMNTYQQQDALALQVTGRPCCTFALSGRQKACGGFFIAWRLF